MTSATCLIIILKLYSNPRQHKFEYHRLLSEFKSTPKCSPPLCFPIARAMFCRAHGNHSGDVAIAAAAADTQTPLIQSNSLFTRRPQKQATLHQLVHYKRYKRTGVKRFCARPMATRSSLPPPAAIAHEVRRRRGTVVCGCVCACATTRAFIYQCDFINWKLFSSSAKRAKLPAAVAQVSEVRTRRTTKQHN